MAGFMDILGTMMQQGMGQSGGTRMKHALGGRGGLEDLLGGLGQMRGGTQSGQMSAAPDSSGMLGDVLGQLANNKAALGGLGALAGALLGPHAVAGESLVSGAVLETTPAHAQPAQQQIPPSPRAATAHTYSPETVERHPNRQG